MAQFDRHPDLEHRARSKEGFRRIPPEPTMVHLLVVFFPVYATVVDYLDNIFPDGKAAAFADPLSAQSRFNSTALLDAWRTQFAEHVLAGNATGHTQVLDNLHQYYCAQWVWKCTIGITREKGIEKDVPVHQSSLSTVPGNFEESALGSQNLNCFVWHVKFDGPPTSVCFNPGEFREQRMGEERAISNFQTHCAFPDPLGIIVRFEFGR
ncbi:hypothetical protein C8R45DRAFT_919543 [Mycena sanguinolenta]|nr:hypothetical protein C8R45DRAFT_919543 [Mycena sanguinolenta]